MSEQATRSVAAQVVDFVLDYVERAGTITGPNGRRVLMLSGGALSFQTGVITPHVEAMVRDVSKIIAGEATYARGYARGRGPLLPGPSKRRASASGSSGGRTSRRQRPA